MDVLLINPPIPLVRTKNTQIERKDQPNFGLCQLASILNLHNFKVGIIDAYSSALNEDAIVKYVEKLKPKIVGLSVLTIALRENYSLINRLKNIENLEIILGGHHITLQPELLKILGLNYALYGEADLSIVPLCNYLIHRKGNIQDIPGLIYIDDDNVKLNKYEEVSDLDALPFPSYDFFVAPVQKQLYYLSASRGCKFACLFCSKYSRRKISFKSPERIVEEMKFVADNIKPQYLILTDETFSVDKERVKEICGLIKKENIKMKWGSMTRIDCIDEETLHILSTVGFCVILLGIESGVERIRKILRKSFSNEKCKNIVKTCKKLEIFTTSFFLLGLPMETKKDINETIKFALELDTDQIYFNTLIMVPGSPIYNQFLKNGMIDNNIWIRYMKGEGDFPLYVPPYFTKDELEAVEIKFYRKFYINFKTIFKIIKNPFDISRYKLLFLILQESFEKEIFRPLKNKFLKILFKR